MVRLRAAPDARADCTLRLARRATGDRGTRRGAVLSVMMPRKAAPGGATCGERAVTNKRSSTSGGAARSGRPERRRCRWAVDADPDYVRYHDEEWGRPVHDDRRLFEMLTLEGAQ